MRPVQSGSRGPQVVRSVGGAVCTPLETGAILGTFSRVARPTEQLRTICDRHSTRTVI